MTENKSIKQIVEELRRRVEWGKNHGNGDLNSTKAVLQFINETEKDLEKREQEMIDELKSLIPKELKDPRDGTLYLIHNTINRVIAQNQSPKEQTKQGVHPAHGNGLKERKDAIPTALLDKTALADNNHRSPETKPSNSVVEDKHSIYITPDNGTKLETTNNQLCKCGHKRLVHNKKEGCKYCSFIQGKECKHFSLKDNEVKK